MMRTPVLLLTLCAALLLRCADDVAGGGIETTNGSTVAGLVVDEGSVPVAGATVWLRPQSWVHGDDAAAVASTTTDSAGEYRFSGVTTGKWVVEAAADHRGWLERFFVGDSDTAMALRDGILRATLSVRGVLDGDGGEVFVYGTDNHAPADSMGAFVIDGVPPGEHLLKAVPAQASLSPTDVLAPAGSDIGIVPLDTVSVLLLDDFTDGDRYHRLAGLLPWARWWGDGPDSASGDFSVLPAGAMDDFTAALEADSTNGGYYAHVTVNIDSMAYDVHGIVGVDIGRGVVGQDSVTAWFDLSRLQTIRFRAKGSGRIHIIPIAWRIVTYYSGADELEAVRDLDSNWTVYEIDVSELAPPLDTDAHRDGVTWDDVSGAISTLTLLTSASMELYLDDFELVGMASSDLLR